MESLIDLSHAYDDNMLLHPTVPKFSRCPHLTYEEHGASLQIISVATHCGTHIDAPAHFFKDGATVDSLPLSNLYGPAIVLDVTGREARTRIRWADIADNEDIIRQSAAQGGILLFRTGWSEYWNTEKYFDHPFLDGDIARKLVEIGLKTFGIDAMGPDETIVETTDVMAVSDFTVHQVALGAGLIIAENLTNLDKIYAGSWMISLAPLKLTGGDGAPVRAYAVRRTNDRYSDSD